MTRFKIKLGEYSDLETVKKSVELRQLLWDSLEMWNARLEDWDVQPFHALDPDELSDFVDTHVHIIEQLESGLPENSVILRYDGSVIQMKNKVYADKFLCYININLIP
jgi:Dynein heavy chain, N-terminal region 2